MVKKDGIVSEMKIEENIEIMMLGACKLVIFLEV